MGKPVNVLRTTICIPRETRARMDAVQQRVNWSAVASRAIEAVLDKIEKGVYREVTLDDVVTRLERLERIVIKT